MEGNGARVGASGQVLVEESNSALAKFEQFFALFRELAKSIGDTDGGAAAWVGDAEAASEFFFEMQHGSLIRAILIQINERSLQKVGEIGDGGGGFSDFFD